MSEYYETKKNKELYENKIVVRNSSIVINDYDMGDCTPLEGSFKMWDIRTHSIYYLGIFYDKENRRLFVPRGMDIYKLKQWFGCEPYIDHNYDTFNKYEDIMLKALPRDDKQREALRFMLGAGEYEDNKYRSQMSLNLNTGKGKTYVSTATIAYESVTSVIITYSKDLLRQWSDKILEYTNLDKKDIFMVTGSQSIIKILYKKHIPRKIYLITHSTLKSFGDTFGWDKVSEFFRLIQAGIKIYDEAHQNFANTCMIDFYTNTWRTYYVTATLMRSDKSENIIFNYYMKNVPKLDLFDKETDPHTKYLAMLYNCGATAREISACRNQYGLNNIKYCNLLLTKVKFWNMLDIIVDFCLKLNGKCLFYIATNNAIKTIHESLTRRYPQLRDNVGIYTSLYNGVEKEKQLDNRFILTTTKSAGAGLDVKGLKCTVVLLEPFVSPVLARQTLGRCRDKNTWYIELVDLAFTQTRRYYYEKMPIFEEYAQSVEHIQFKDSMIEERVYDIVSELWKQNYRAPIAYFEPTNHQRCISFTMPQTRKPKVISFLSDEELKGTKNWSYSEMVKEDF